VLDPGTPAEALEMALRAFDLSEKYEIPVLLRPCLRVCHARQNVSLGEPLTPTDAGPFEKNWTRWAAIPRFRLVLHGELNEKLQIMRREEPETRPEPVNVGRKNPIAVITSGSVSSHVHDIVASDHRLRGINVYKVAMPFPADQDALQKIVDAHQKTLVIEETYPVLELQIYDRRTVLGRMSGHVPSQGELIPEIVEDIIVGAVGLEPIAREAPKTKPKRPSLCPGCPHRPAFYMIKSIFDEAVYAGDIGCYTLGINMGAVDTCLCMGASVGMAGGLVRGPNSSGPTRVVATIGDSTFYHAGVAPLINAVHTRAPFVLVIMDNSMTAMTGGQPTPANDHLADGSPAIPVDMERLVRGCGVELVETVDPYDHDALKQGLEKARTYTFEQKRGVSVLITRRPCVRAPNVKLPSDKYQIGDKCDLCMSCVKDLECPAIGYVKGEKRLAINEDLCAGCGFCVTVCPSQAIERKGI
jgi:indolepyruvate ferredoxin oxidoreductase alpha subunit